MFKSQTNAKLTVNSVVLVAIVIVTIANIYLFGHLIGPLVFFMVCAFMLIITVKNSENAPLSALAFVVVGNLYYNYLETVHWVGYIAVDIGASYLFHLILSMVIALAVAMPLLFKTRSIEYMFLYAISVICIGAGSFPEYMLCILIANTLFMAFGLLVATRRLMLSLITISIVINCAIFLMPYVESRGMSVIYGKLLANMDTNSMSYFSIALTITIVKLIIGFLFALSFIIARSKLIGDIEDNSLRDVNGFVALVTVIVVCLTGGALHYISINKSKDYVKAPENVRVKFIDNDEFSLPIPHGTKIRYLGNDNKVITSLGVAAILINDEAKN